MKEHNTSHHRFRPAALVKLPQGLHHDGGGLYLQVRGSSRSWLFRWWRDDKAKVMGLGPTHTVGLALARERAREARLLVLDGGDPLTEREAARSARRLKAAT